MKIFAGPGPAGRRVAAAAVALAAATLAAPTFASTCTSTSSAPNQSPYGVKVLPWCEKGGDRGPESRDGAVWMRKEQPSRTAEAAQRRSAAHAHGGPNADPAALPWNRDLD